MDGAIRTRIVRIGNSQGVRIPKPLLEQSGIHAEVEIEVHGDHLVVRAAPQRRVSWEAAFAEMAERQDDALLDDESTIDWDQLEWEW